MNRTAMLGSGPTHGHTPKGNEHRVTERYGQTHAHSSISQDSQVKANQVPTNTQLDKQMVVHTHSGVFIVQT